MFRPIRWLTSKLCRRPKAEPKSVGADFTVSFDHDGNNYRLLAKGFLHSGTRHDWAQQSQGEAYRPQCQFLRVIGPTEHMHVFYTLFGDAVSGGHDMHVECEGHYPCLLQGVILTQIGHSVQAGDFTCMEELHAVCREVSDLIVPP